MKRNFRLLEAVFDFLYLGIAMIIGLILIISSANNSARIVAGIAALTLAFGDSFHLIPRIIHITKPNITERIQYFLGREANYFYYYDFILFAAMVDRNNSFTHR